jgi:acyl-CoA thioesterase-2
VKPALSLDAVVSCLTGPEPIDWSERGALWSAPTLRLAGGAVFGGQLLGQAITISAKLEPSMTVKSISVVFPRAVRDSGSVRFDVACLHQGSAYATRRIDVVQPDRAGREVTACSANVIATRAVDGLAHERPCPAGAGRLDDARTVDLGIVPWECRIAGQADLDDRRAQPNELALWTRVERPLPDDGYVHQALLAYLTDLTLIGTALLAHDGWSQLDAHSALRTSVIAHQVWFHRPFRIDDWLVLTQTSPAAAGGSAFGTGDVHNREGELVASFAQESMIRLPEEDNHEH